MHDLLILDDSLLSSMARNPNFVQEFPVLKSAIVQVSNEPGTAVMHKKRCGDCNTTVTQSVLNNMNQVKYSLANMSKEKKQKLLQMLNAKQIRIRVSVDSRVAVYTIID